MGNYVFRRRKYQEMIVTGNCLMRGLRKGTAFKPRGKTIIQCHPERGEGFAFRHMPREKQIPHSMQNANGFGMTTTEF
jgi:hypothetical protein